MVNVLVVDDHSLMRRAVREVVEKEEGMAVIAEASNGEEAEIQAAQTQPDVVLMDVDMPDCNGFEATERVLACSPHSRVVIFTAAHQEHLVVQAIQKGAMGYITKDIEPDALIHAIKCAARNDLCIPGAFATQMLSHLRAHWKGLANGMMASPISYRVPHRKKIASATEDELPLPEENANLANLPRPLTERERQILDLMRKGRKNREISIELEIAESTVHKHVQNIFEKLHARNRTEAIYLTSFED
jgi:two-component system, NarL family, nitrate/nitrite response regulator NarL